MNDELKKYYSNSVLPIFSYLPNEHEKVELVGSGLYAKYKNFYLIVTDAHVINDERLNQQIVIPNNQNNELEVAPTERKYVCKDKNIDLGFYILSEPLNSFTPLELIEPVKQFNGVSVRFIGYPASKSKYKYFDVKGCPYGINGKISYNDKFRIAINYDEKNICVDGKKINPPDLHGISGGPVFIYNNNEIQLIGFTESVDLKEKKLYATKAEYLYKLLENLEILACT